MTSSIIAALASQQPKPDSVAAIGVVVLAIVVVVVIGASSSALGSPPNRIRKTEKAVNDGFRPIGQGNTGRKRAKSTRTLGSPRTPATRDRMKGTATKPRVDWITGEKIND